jgi:CAAX prenyl protease-like protein
VSEPVSSIQPTKGIRVRDDLAYLLPMFVFGIFTWIGVQWPNLYTTSYVSKTILTALCLVILRKSYTKLRWNYWWLGALMGVLGVVQWVGMEKLLMHVRYYPHSENLAPFNPFESIASPGWRWSFIAIRWGGAALVVPVMEELFWRDFLWRTIVAPVDFKLAQVGEVDWKAFLLVSFIFCSAHPQWWATALVWGLMIAGLLATTRSLGACIVMHGVTNFLLGLYVLKTGDWYFW